MVRNPTTLILLIMGLLLMGASLLVTTSNQNETKPRLNKSKDKIPTGLTNSNEGQNLQKPQSPLNNKLNQGYSYITNERPLKTQTETPTETTSHYDKLDDIAYLEIILPASLGPSGGEFQIIDGEVYELENGEAIKTTRLEIEGLSNIVICIERYIGMHRVSQEFYDGEELMVTYPAGIENQTTILSILSDKYRYSVRDSKVYIYIPFNKKISISKYLEQINQEISGVGVSSLIKKDF